MHFKWRIFIFFLPGLAAQAASAQSLPPAPTALAEAARDGQLAAIDTLLTAGADPDTPGPLGTPALHWLIERGDLEAASVLLAAGADPNRATRLQLTPLYLAAKHGDAEAIQLLLSAGADPNRLDPAGETMLMAAVRAGDLASVNALLEAGAEVDAREAGFQQTALMLAARQGETAIAAKLLETGAAVDASTEIGSEPRWVLPNSRPGFSFGIGIIRGGLPEDRGMRPFRSGGLTPLLYAAREGHADTIALLLDAGADIEGVEANGITPLLMAIANDRASAATLLIERGANLDTSDWYGRTPLWSAVNVRNLYLDNATFEHFPDRDAQLELIRLLLALGADPDPRTKESPPVRNHILPSTGTLEWVDFTGQTPFLTAALAGDTTVMQLLIEHGADPQIGTFHGTTPLMAAAGVNWVVSQTYTEGPDALLEAVEICLALGMDTNAANSMGITAVMGAANRGSNDIIELLVTHGARLDVADNEGRTPLDWARGVFLATHPAEPKPESIALIERLLGD